MFDGFHRHRFAGQSGLVLDSTEVRDGCRNLETAEVATLKADAVVCGSRFQRKSDFVARMEADASTGYRPAECTLRVHDLSSRVWESSMKLSKAPASDVSRV